MPQLVTCSKCGLKYGAYSTFHRFPDDVERERRRHDCRLIQLCRRWDKLIRGPFYWDPRGRGQCDGDPPDAATQTTMVEIEDRAAEAKVVFKVRTAAYTRAEARACSRTFAAAQADRALRHAGMAACYVGGKVATVCVDARARAAAIARAAVAERAARWARADVAAKAEALNRAMDAVENSAWEAGVLLPPRCPVRDDDDGDGDHGGRIVFADVSESDCELDCDSDVDDSEEYVMGLLNGEYTDEDTGDEDKD